MAVTGLLDAKQVANILGVSVRAVYRLTDKKAIACVKWGRSVRISPDDLAQFIASHKVEAIDLEALAETHCVEC